MLISPEPPPTPVTPDAAIPAKDEILPLPLPAPTVQGETVDLTPAGTAAHECSFLPTPQELKDIASLALDCTRIASPMGKRVQWQDNQLINADELVAINRKVLETILAHAAPESYVAKLANDALVCKESGITQLNQTIQALNGIRHAPDESFSDWA